MRHSADLSEGAAGQRNECRHGEKDASSDEEEEYANQPGKYDVDMSDFVIKSNVDSSKPCQKENLQSEDNQDAKKVVGRGRSRKQKKTTQKVPLTQATPVARRTRAGRRACTAIENVQ